MNRVGLADGTSLAVAETGPADAPALVWGHGLSSSMEAETELAVLDWTIAAPSHRVVRYDARGHGVSESSPAPDDYRWQRLAGDQLAVVDDLGIGRYVAGGASMGCATALFAALEAPERIDRLVLMIPPTAWETRANQVEMYETMADLLEQGRTDALVAGLDAAPVPDPFRDDSRWRDSARARLLAADPARLARVFRGAALADLPERALLRSVHQPALVLAWTGDPGHPTSTAEQLAELLPHAELHLASTAPQLARWSDLVADFVEPSPR